MKMDVMALGVKGDNPKTEMYSTNQDDLECMLQHIIAAKKIEGDPTIFNRVKEYALSKNEMIEKMFSGEKEPVKSISDLKKVRKKKMDEYKAKLESGEMDEYEDEDEE